MMIAPRWGSRFFIVGLAAVILMTSRVTVHCAQPAASAWLDELNRLAQHIGHSVPTDALDSIETAATSGRPEIRALRAALLYRADPKKWGSELAAAFTINDYALRAGGETTEISQEEFVSRIKKVESAYPSLQAQVVMLVAFIELRDANLWFPQDDQRVSVARFLRGAFLAQAFRDSSLDPVSVANQLDQNAREKHELGLKSKQ